MAEDDLEALRDELIAKATIGTAGDAVDAVSVLFTAGFSILMEEIGSQHAVGAMRTIVDAVGTRMVN